MTIRLSVVLVALLLGLSGCVDDGDDDGDGTDPGNGDGENDDTDTNDAGAQSVERTVRATGPLVTPRFDPDRFEVPSGAAVKVTLINDDPTAPHAWRLEGVDGASTDNASPGESAEVSFVAPEPGEYVFYCPVGNHRQLGQEGTLVVTAS